MGGKSNGNSAGTSGDYSLKTNLPLNQSGVNGQDKMSNGSEKSPFILPHSLRFDSRANWSSNS